ncbi:uncharacterized protein K441DRAFT_715005, partial [Cenococcum geophilum 1.58]|uniref:uncharacterized protein n=1 Tax=Cenococcum geophilum 1.58 TaxID=794803 RepID=UPI0035900FEE
KGYIKPSQSLIGYPVLFILKKNGKLRLCINYKQTSIYYKNTTSYITQQELLLHPAQKDQNQPKEP